MMKKSSLQFYSSIGLSKQVSLKQSFFSNTVVYYFEYTILDCEYIFLYQSNLKYVF